MTSHLSELPIDHELNCCALFGPCPGKNGHAVKVCEDNRTGTTAFTVEGSEPFSQVLLDQNGYFWLAPWIEQLSDSADILVYNDHGELAGTLNVVGRPHLYESEDFLFAGCEGEDGVSRIYQFSKQDLIKKNEWKIDGFVWGLLFNQDVLFASCYLPDENLAVLYVLGDQREAAIELGENFFPTDLFYLNQNLYISACPVMGREKSRILQLDDTFNTTREWQVNTPPRRIYANESDLIVYGREIVRGRKEKLIYCNLENGQRREYSIPNVHKIKAKDDRLYLVSSEENAVLVWDSRKRKFVNKHPVPEMGDRPLLDFHCHR